jgi:UDP-N-acetylmuramoyl-tripeptide--D-alanyl-D-alanine ligase
MIADEARAAGMSPAAVETFDTVVEVIERLQHGLRPGDFVLVKGSRGMHLDDVVTAIRVVA